MKKTTMIALLTLILALLMQFACAEPSSVVQGVFDALIAEGSDYNQTKSMMMAYYEGVQWEETVEGDSIVISVSNSEYMDGSWTFTQEGDYLTASFAEGNFTDMTLTMSVLKAVGSSLGMQTDVMSGYVNGLSFLGIETDDFVMEQDEAVGKTTVRINDTKPWDMSALDQMVLDERIVEPLEDGYTSTAANFGKLMMVANKSDDGMVILLGEFGGLDDLAYKSIINVVGILKPAGWDDFTAMYTELKDVDTSVYSVKLNVPKDEVLQIIEDPKDSYSYAILRFASGAAYGEESGAEDSNFETPAPAEAPAVEAFEKEYFDVLANLESGTAGSSLKTAVAASEVCAFAEAYSLYNPDVETMRANMLAAFEGMDEDRQAAFQTNFDAVRALLDECLEDYDANRAIFEDAGVAEKMDEIMYDPLNRLAWENLRDHTLTMGNAENVG